MGYARFDISVYFIGKVKSMSCIFQQFIGKSQNRLILESTMETEVKDYIEYATDKPRAIHSRISKWSSRFS